MMEGVLPKAGEEPGPEWLTKGAPPEKGMTPGEKEDGQRRDRRRA